MPIFENITALLGHSDNISENVILPFHMKTSFFLIDWRSEITATLSCRNSRFCVGCGGAKICERAGNVSIRGLKDVFGTGTVTLSYLNIRIVSPKNDIAITCVIFFVL